MIIWCLGQLEIGEKKNYILISEIMDFLVGHGNTCANTLTSHDSSISGFFLWDNSPHFI